ncbi:MAG: putative transposase [Celeribacter sp.]|jgi:putative transposase
MCRVMRVHFSGFYAWLKEPLSPREFEDVRQTEMIQQAWTDSGKVYGYRKLADDLRDARETCSENRVTRLTNIAGIAAQIGYKRRWSVWRQTSHRR